MAAGEQVVPPPPAGFTLDAVPPPPAGFRLNAPIGPSEPQTETKPFTPSGDKSAGSDILERAMNALRGANTLAGYAPHTIPGRLLQQGEEDLSKAAYNLGGNVTDATGSPEAGAVANAAVAGIPALIGTKGGAPVMRAGAERLMQSAMKPDAAARVSGYRGAPSEAVRGRRFMLDEGINASEGGVARLREMAAKGKDDINAAVARGEAAGATVDKTAIAAGQPAIERKFSASMDPKRRDSDLAAVRDRYLDWLTDPAIPSRIPVGQAQALKEGEQAYLRNANKFGQPTNVPDVAVSKDMTRQMRLQLEKAMPEIKQLNQREAEIINALAIADKRAAIAGNANIGGIALLNNNPKALAAMMLDRSSLFKSVLARMINAHQNVGGVAGALVGASTGEPPQ